MINLELWKQRKKELKLSYYDIAEKTGISISTIKDIFRGATLAPRIDTVAAIECALGLDKPQISFEQIANDLLVAVSLIKEYQAEEKNYISAFLKFFRDEVAQLRKPFRKMFKECGSVVALRKYFIDGLNGVKIEYEARFLRFGYNIVCRSDNLKDLKQQFIERANKLF